MMRRRVPVLLAILFSLVWLPGRLGAHATVESRLLAGDIDALVQDADPGVHLTDELELRSYEGRSWVAPPATHLEVDVYNVNTREQRRFVFSPRGELLQGTETDLEWFFRCKRSRRTHEMAPEVLAMLAEVGRHFPGHTIEIVSGYRRTGFGVRRSKHYTGHAIDFRVRGVPLSEVRDFVWSRFDHVGVGHYVRERFVHMDYRPDEDKTAWNQSRPGAHYHYAPRWSR
jgi:uncharacterized protein YcbK (DUF882 family)